MARVIDREPGESKERLHILLRPRVLAGPHFPKVRSQGLAVVGSAVGPRRLGSASARGLARRPAAPPTRCRSRTGSSSLRCWPPSQPNDRQAHSKNHRRPPEHSVLASSFIPPPAAAPRPPAPRHAPECARPTVADAASSSTLISRFSSQACAQVVEARQQRRGVDARRRRGAQIRRNPVEDLAPVASTTSSDRRRPSRRREIVPGGERGPARPRRASSQSLNLRQRSSCAAARRSERPAAAARARCARLASSSLLSAARSTSSLTLRAAREEADAVPGLEVALRRRAGSGGRREPIAAGRSSKPCVGAGDPDRIGVGAAVEVEAGELETAAVALGATPPRRTRCRRPTARRHGSALPLGAAGPPRRRRRVRGSRPRPRGPSSAIAQAPDPGCMAGR